MKEIIAINIQKGGCAKTVTTQALAEIFSKDYGLKVLCIDTDPQCNLTTVSGVSVVDCKYNLYTLLKDQSSLQESIVETTYYDLIPGSMFLANADNEFNVIGKEQFLKERIENAKYDLILIDTPPALGLLNIMSLTAATKVLIPSEPSYLSLMGLSQLYNTILTVKKYLNNSIELLGLAVIKYKERANINQAILEALQSSVNEMGTRLFDSKIRETVKIREAQSQMVPLVDWDEKCTAVQDYKELAKEIYTIIK